MSDTQQTTYRPAPRSFLRVCRFAAFLRSIELEKLDQAEPEAAAESVLRPVTIAEQSAPAESDVQQGLTITDLLTAVIVQERGPEIAQVIVQAVEPGGTVRDVTAADAKGDGLDSDTFALAFTLFLARQSVLIGGLSATGLSTG
jgi:hypothetical protein